MNRVAVKFVPCLLLEDQRANRLDMCREMKDQLKTGPDICPKSSQVMKHCVTGTIQRQSNNQVNEKVHHLRDQKKGEASQIKCENHVDLLL